MIDDIISDLGETWNLTSEELSDIKIAMAGYAVAASRDPVIKSEALEIVGGDEGD